MPRLLAPAGSWLLLCLVLGACTSNHDLLAAHPSSGGGSGGALPEGGGGGGAGGGQGGSDGGSLPDATIDVTEPSGPDRLTLVHGVVDAARITFCFASVDPGGASTPVGSPVPAAGLDFAHAASVAALPGLDFAKDNIQPIVIAGDLSMVKGMTCAAAIALAEHVSAPDAGTDAASDGSAPADAGADAASDGSAPADAGAEAASDGSAPADAGTDASTDAAPDAPASAVPALRVAALPVLPAGTLSGGRSYLLVAAGCMGAPGFSGGLDQAVCGTGYAPDQPTLAPVVVHMSRITQTGRLGLQVVNASRGTDTLDVQSGTPPHTTHDPLPIASGVAFGAILPRPPDLDEPLSAYGVPFGTVPLEARSGSTSGLTVNWASVLALGGISKLEDDHTYALIVVGPRIDIGAAGWWNLPAITVVPTAP